LGRQLVFTIALVIVASFLILRLTLSIIGIIDEMNTPLGKRNRDSLGIKTIENSLAN